MFLGKQAIYRFVFLLISSTSFTGGTNNVLADHLPIISGAAGFGITTHAGRGGTVYKVTSLKASGPGSLKDCIDRTEPRICLFEVSGTIEVSGDLKIANPYITIAGQTAPSPGITIKGGGLRIKASHVLIQHLRVRVGHPANPPCDNRDALRIDPGGGRAPISHIVIDHSSFSWSTDEVASIANESGDVTIRHSIFSEPLHDSCHSKGKHGYGPLIGGGNGGTINLTMTGNLFAHQHSRNPLTRAAKLVFVNNVIYNWGARATGFETYNTPPSKNSLVGNHYKSGVNSAMGRPFWLSGRRDSFSCDAKFYLKDNYADYFSYGSQWDLVGNASTCSRGQLEVDTPPTWNERLSVKGTENDEALNWVLANVGARSIERDSVDSRVINSVRNGTGRIINCVTDDGSERCGKNAGGWPKLVQNRRILTLPDDPSGDDDADGYTNLEEWLHAYAAEVEGRALGGT